MTKTRIALFVLYAVLLPLPLYGWGVLTLGGYIVGMIPGVSFITDNRG